MMKGKIMNGKPTQDDPRTQQLHALHHATGQLVALESASKSPRIVIDGDIEVAWPQEVKDQIDARIVTRQTEIAASIRDLQNGD